METFSSNHRQSNSVILPSDANIRSTKWHFLNYSCHQDQSDICNRVHVLYLRKNTFFTNQVVSVGVSTWRRWYGWLDGLAATVVWLWECWWDSVMFPDDKETTYMTFFTFLLHSLSFLWWTNGEICYFFMFIHYFMNIYPVFRIMWNDALCNFNVRLEQLPHLDLNFSYSTL